jgi:hypothetical protein
VRAVLADAAGGRARAVWWVWRFPGLPTVWPPPRPVFLIQAGRSGDHLPELAAGVAERLEHAGEVAPQVEVFAEVARLPPYQRAALAEAELVWSSRGTEPVRVARVFDPVATAGGPGFDTARARLPEAERDRILSYLDSGTPVVTSSARLDDVVSGGRHAAVPAGFRTDGVWVWCDAATYYLRRYGLAPDAALRDHIVHRAPATAPAVDLLDVHRALAALRAVPVG